MHEKVQLFIQNVVLINGKQCYGNSKNKIEYNNTAITVKNI